MGTSAFPPLTTAEQIFKSLIWDPMIKAGETWIEAQVPILDLPVIKQIDEGVISILTDAIFSQIVLIVDVESIQLVSSEMQSAYNDASEQLAIIAEQQGVTSDAFKQAQEKALASLAQFTHMGP